MTKTNLNFNICDYIIEKNRVKQNKNKKKKEKIQIQTKSVNINSNKKALTTVIYWVRINDKQ